MQSGRSTLCSTEVVWPAGVLLGVVLSQVRSLGSLFSDQVAALQARCSEVHMRVLQKAEGAQGSIRSVFKNQFTRVNTVSLWGENVRIICCWIIFIREKQRCLWIWYMFLKIGGM